MAAKDGSSPDRGTANISWLVTGIFTIAGMMGLWWAQTQQQSIQQQASSTLQQPAGLWILWSITLMAVGVCFGLAVASGSGWRSRLPMSALLWGAVPLAMVLAFHLWVAQTVEFPIEFLQVLVGIQMQVASAVAVGFFLSGLMAPLLPTPKSRPPAGA
jgi:hypothetical protein